MASCYEILRSWFRYEEAEMLRIQIEMDEIDAYDALIARRAQEVDQVRKELQSRQQDELDRLQQCVTRVQQLMPRLVSMCNATEKGAWGHPALNEEAELEELIRPMFSAIPPFLSNY